VAGNDATSMANPDRIPGGRNRFLAALLPDDFAALRPHVVETVLDRGAVLQEPGQPLERVFFPHGGIVSLTATLATGEVVECAAIGREGAIGLSAGLGATVAPSRAVVQLEGQAAQMSASRLADLAAERKSLRDLIGRYQDIVLAQVQQVALCNTVHHVQQRLCRSLLCMYDRIDGDIVALTQEFLSGMLGVQRTTVTAMCRMLQADGIIDVRRGRIQIRDLLALRRRSCCCHDVIRNLNDRIGQ
jgi:CRP-like cAMP-binding protein